MRTVVTRQEIKPMAKSGEKNQRERESGVRIGMGWDILFFAFFTQ
jgi:hypothetical protein